MVRPSAKKRVLDEKQSKRTFYKHHDERCNESISRRNRKRISMKIKANLQTTNIMMRVATGVKGQSTAQERNRKCT